MVFRNKPVERSAPSHTVSRLQPQQLSELDHAGELSVWSRIAILGAPDRLASDRLCARARRRPASRASDRTRACASPMPTHLRAQRQLGLRGLSLTPDGTRSHIVPSQPALSWVSNTGQGLHPKQCKLAAARPSGLTSSLHRQLPLLAFNANSSGDGGTFQEDSKPSVLHAGEVEEAAHQCAGIAARCASSRCCHRMSPTKSKVLTFRSATGSSSSGSWRLASAPSCCHDGAPAVPAVRF